MFGLPLYLRNAARQHQSSAAQMAQHIKCTRKSKKNGEKE